jgi:hypothetical protein
MFSGLKWRKNAREGKKGDLWALGDVQNAVIPHGARINRLSALAHRAADTVGAPKTAAQLCQFGVAANAAIQ